MDKYVVIDELKNTYQFKSLRNIETVLGIDHSYLSKLIKNKLIAATDIKIKVKKYSIYLLYNLFKDSINDNKNIKLKYILINSNNQGDIYKSLREIERKIHIDHSSLSKLLRNKKYKSLGGNNPGRPTTDNKNSGFNILKVV